MVDSENKKNADKEKGMSQFFLMWLWKSGCASLIFIILILFLPIWIWYWWRIEPKPGQFAVLLRKTGKDLPPNEIIALSKDTKGIQLDVLPEGRYFRNPYTWFWTIHSMTDIPAGKMGIKVRLYGKELDDGKIIAKDENQKGIMPEVLAPGKYRINPYAYDVIILDAVQIKPGYIGVVTLWSGKTRSIAVCLNLSETLILSEKT